tara:strand:- start:330 stop:605 length:276 start_codon:yes stop_codon:yes gene_type:complete
MQTATTAVERKAHEIATEASKGMNVAKRLINNRYGRRPGRRMTKVNQERLLAEFNASHAAMWTHCLELVQEIQGKDSYVGKLMQQYLEGDE